jgi:hypothetical protein
MFIRQFLMLIWYLFFFKLIPTCANPKRIPNDNYCSFVPTLHLIYIYIYISSGASLILVNKHIYFKEHRTEHLINFYDKYKCINRYFIGNQHIYCSLLLVFLFSVSMLSFQILVFIISLSFDRLFIDRIY